VFYLIYFIFLIDCDFNKNCDYNKKLKYLIKSEYKLKIWCHILYIKKFLFDYFNKIFIIKQRTNGGKEARHRKINRVNIKSNKKAWRSNKFKIVTIKLFFLINK